MSQRGLSLLVSFLSLLALAGCNNEKENGNLNSKKSAADTFVYKPDPNVLNDMPVAAPPTDGKHGATPFVYKPGPDVLNNKTIAAPAKSGAQPFVYKPDPDLLKGDAATAKNKAPASPTAADSPARQ